MALIDQVRASLEANGLVVVNAEKYRELMDAVDAEWSKAVRVLVAAATMARTLSGIKMDKETSDEILEYIDKSLDLWNAVMERG